MPDSQPALSFTAFVLSLASTAAIHFGDLADPVSGERSELNLEGAAQMIEILSLLEQKTRGNLTAEERQVLEQVLYELRMRFVEAAGGGKLTPTDSNRVAGVGPEQGREMTAGRLAHRRDPVRIGAE